jgi:hypothetical protein
MGSFRISHVSIAAAVFVALAAAPAYGELVALASRPPTRCTVIPDEGRPSQPPTQSGAGVVTSNIVVRVPRLRCQRGGSGGGADTIHGGGGGPVSRPGSGGGSLPFTGFVLERAVTDGLALVGVGGVIALCGIRRHRA